jgi:predicted kinase
MEQELSVFDGSLPFSAVDVSEAATAASPGSTLVSERVSLLSNAPITAMPSVRRPFVPVTNHSQKQWLVVLVGLPGCGKSTFAKGVSAQSEQNQRDIMKFLGQPGASSAVTDNFELGLTRRDESSLSMRMPRMWQFVNQDVHKTRAKCIKAIVRNLREGHSVIVDRCNFDIEQRHTWIELAKDHCVEAACIMLPSAFDVAFCTQRAIQRGADGVHQGTEDWTSICGQIGAKCELPTRDEGFTTVVNCKSQSDLENARSMMLGGDFSTANLDVKAPSVEGGRSLPDGREDAFGGNDLRGTNMSLFDCFAHCAVM